MRVELDSPECGAGCESCYLDCAMTRHVIAARDREIEELHREQPPRVHPRWAGWRAALSEAQAHRRQLLLRLARIAPTPLLPAQAGVLPLGSRLARLH